MNKESSMFRRTVLAVLLAAASFSSFAAEEAKPAAAAAPVAAAPQNDAAKGQAIAAGVCAGCHGADGNSPIPVNPILAGQGADYIAKQLMDFRSVNGKPPARMNPIMAGMAMMVPPEEAKNVGAWFASQKPKGQPEKDPKTLVVGQKLWRGGDLVKGIPACAGCHGATGAGLPAQYPRLAGQYPEYTEAQLKAFRAGDRANDAEKVMRMIAAKMSDVEIKAVAEYAASLR
jgi:cytochrome c553